MLNTSVPCRIYWFVFFLLFPFRFSCLVLDCNSGSGSVDLFCSRTGCLFITSSFFKDRRAAITLSFLPLTLESESAQLLRPGNWKFIHFAAHSPFPHGNHSNRPGSRASQWGGFEEGKVMAAWGVCVCVCEEAVMPHTHTGSVERSHTASRLLSVASDAECFWRDPNHLGGRRGSSSSPPSACFLRFPVPLSRYTLRFNVSAFWC